MLDIDTNSILLDRPIIKQSLAKEEYLSLKKERYSDKDGWQLSKYVRLLENKCPCCSENLIIAYQSSPKWTWEELCGRAGYLVYCPKCKKDINFYLTVMN
jgi:hypothetical protein